MHDQQAKGFAIFLRLNRMMCAMSTQDRARIGSIQLSEPGKPLVDVYVVDEKIDQSVNGDAHAYKKHPELWGYRTQDIKQGTGNGKDQKEPIVLLKKFALLEVGLVMIFMPVPKEAMHQVLMRKPGDELHGGSSRNGNEDIEQDLHEFRYFPFMQL